MSAITFFATATILGGHVAVVTSATAKAATAATTATAKAATAAAAAEAATTTATVAIAAVTTAATATAVTTAAAAEAATTTLFARLGFVQLQWTTAKLGVAIHQLLNGLTTFVVSHLDKSEAAGTSRLTVHNKVHALHFAEFRKKTRHLILGDTEGEIPHINTDHDSVRFCSRSPMQDKNEKQKIPFGVRSALCRGPDGRSEHCASIEPAASRGKQFFKQTSTCPVYSQTRRYAIGDQNTSPALGTNPQSSQSALVRAP